MVFKLNTATIIQIIELYKKDNSISQIARTLGLSKGVVHKYVEDHRQGRLNDLPPLTPLTITHKADESISVNIHDYINQETINSLHILRVKEGYASIDECLKGLIDIYLDVKTPLESYMRQKLERKKHSDIYSPMSYLDYNFGNIHSSILGSATINLAKSFDRNAGFAVNAAWVAATESYLSTDFMRDLMKESRKWYDKNRVNFLAAKGIPKDLIDQMHSEIELPFVDLLIRKSYSRAKAEYDLAVTKNQHKKDHQAPDRTS
jgi:transposase-like protein